MIEVVSGLIVKDKRVLLTQRKDTLEWETPGGKVAGMHESHLSALQRELFEELSIWAVVLHEQASWCGAVGNYFFLLYYVKSYAATPKPLENQGIGWFTSSEVKGLNLTPCTKACKIQILTAL